MSTGAGSDGRNPQRRGHRERVVERVEVIGVGRFNGRVSMQKPLTDRHRDVLARLSDVPAPRVDLARDLGLTDGQAGSALYVLSARQLARPTPAGWVLT